MPTPQVVILGAGYAGQMAAARIAKRRPDVRLTVVDSSPTFVERIRLHQIAAGGTVRERPMATLLPRPARFLNGQISKWDPTGRSLAVATEVGTTDLTYDWCVLALGSRVGRSTPGVAQHAHTLDDPSSAAKAAARLTKGARVLIVGAGLTGIEVATELGERRPDVAVTLVASAPFGMGLSEAGTRHVRSVLRRHRVTVRERTRVATLEEHGAVTDGGEAISFDLCLWNGGFVASPLAAQAGLPVNARGQVRVDDRLRVPDHPEILVAGDAAEVAGPEGQPLRMACATAMPMGTHAGEAVAKLIAGETPKPFRFAYKIRCISLGRRDGLIQHVDEVDAPVPHVWTGRTAATLKEIVCRSTVLSIRGEGRFRIPFYRWPQPSRQTAGLRQAATAGD